MFELRWIDYQAAAALKAAVALAATILLLWWWRAPEPRPRSIARVQDGALAALGVLAFVAWWNFGALHYRAGAIHHYEFFHYYIGAKYSPELGYTGLYDCVAAAEIESGRAPQVAIRWIRDLKTNELRRGSPALNADGSRLQRLACLDDDRPPSG